MLYFTLCNLGLVALITPVRVDSRVRTLDWPFLVAVTWLAAFFLWRGRAWAIWLGVTLLAADAVICCAECGVS